jgi:membrane-associated phospholipid phosphatase
MVAETGIYITWVTGAILLSIIFMPIFRPPYAKITVDGFIDMFRRYWAHIIIVFSVYIWKDLFDGLDRSLMANTRIDMTPYVYAVEGNIVLWVQEGFRSILLDQFLTHFYVMGFMAVTFSSLIYPIYFDDRHMADRVCMSIFWVYTFAIPFYLFFNVRVTGDHIPLMETIAYDLTPEIHNWFTRIDPFTNGMPSLHIGLPFAVWLSMQKWDEDGRWMKYRNFLLIFISLTAFSIIYLGIHWLVDIIGGMIIAILAVRMTDRTHKKLWNIFDERRFSSRLARVLDNPKRYFVESMDGLGNVIEPFKEPSKKQTSLFIAVLIVSTGSVLLWDATHQHFPIEGSEWPTSTSGKGGWLVTIEEFPDGAISISAWNTTTLKNYTISTKPWGMLPNAITSDEGFALFSDERIDYFEFNDSSEILQPLFRYYPEEPITNVSLGSNSDGFVILISHNSFLTILNKDGELIPNSLKGPFNTFTASDNLIAWSSDFTNNLVVNITSLDLQLKSTIEINAKDPLSDTTLLSEDIIIDYPNSTIKELILDGKWLVALVDLGYMDRLVLVDIFSGNQSILGDPLWQSSSPSIYENNIAFLQIPSWSPTFLNQESSEPNDVWLHDTSMNQTSRLTYDNLNQIQPHALGESVVWTDVKDDGNLEVIVYPLKEIFRPYSSVLIQSAILMLIPLIFVWASQSAREKQHL